MIVTTVLLLVMTYPTVEHIFRTDEFWLPTGNSTDVFVHIWDIWYGNQILNGQADRSYTDLLFYPEGVSLVHHPFSGLPVIISVQLALQSLLPISNAFTLTFLLVVYANALATYLYCLWLFKNKWIALFGAVALGFSPHVMGLSYSLHDGFLATFVLAIYCFHRGMKERHMTLVFAAGIFAGLTATVTLYSFVCLMISLAAGVCAFAVEKWRERDYWRNIGILSVAIAISSIWTVYPMMAGSQSLEAALEWHGGETTNDLISSFVNHNNPILGPLLESVLMTPANAKISVTSYLGYVPLLLVSAGLMHKATNRNMLPWLLLFIGFFVLRLGSFLYVNGIEYSDVWLPKYYLNEILPFAFKPFTATSRFQIGALLPFTMLACYGLAAVGSANLTARRSWFIVLLIGLMAVEFYVPVRERVFYDDQFAYNDWLAEEDTEIRLINLPMGRKQSKLYSLYQSINGYPQVEGAISRTPDEAFNYIRSNSILSAWFKSEPVSCLAETKADYLFALDRLEADGFTHVVFHRHVGNNESRAAVGASLAKAVPAYEDNVVSIYRMHDLRQSCPTSA